MYVCQLSLLQLLIWAGYRHFKESEAICCCLQTCNVDVVLLVMYCMYIPAFIVTTVLHPKRVHNALFHSMWIFSAILQAKHTYNISS